MQAFAVGVGVGVAVAQQYADVRDHRGFLDPAHHRGGEDALEDVGDDRDGVAVLGSQAAGHGVRPETHHLDGLQHAGLDVWPDVAWRETAVRLGERPEYG